VSSASEIKRLGATADAYKWGYEYLQSRMEDLGRHGWAHDCDHEIEMRIRMSMRDPAPGVVADAQPHGPVSEHLMRHWYGAKK
jgi:hypothetical protein